MSPLASMPAASIHLVDRQLALLARAFGLLPGVVHRLPSSPRLSGAVDACSTRSTNRLGERGGAPQVKACEAGIEAHAAGGLVLRLEVSRCSRSRIEPAAQNPWP